MPTNATTVWEIDQKGQLDGVMGIQDKGTVTLIRHAYVRSGVQQQGIGTRLLKHFEGLTQKPILIGTWAAATWARRFYEKHGFREVDRETKDRLLRTYWSIPARQTETSVG